MKAPHRKGEEPRRRKRPEGPFFLARSQGAVRQGRNHVEHDENVEDGDEREPLVHGNDLLGAEPWHRERPAHLLPALRNARVPRARECSNFCLTRLTPPKARQRPGETLMAAAMACRRTLMKYLTRVAGDTSLILAGSPPRTNSRTALSGNAVPSMIFTVEVCRYLPTAAPSTEAWSMYMPSSVVPSKESQGITWGDHQQTQHKQTTNRANADVNTNADFRAQPNNQNQHQSRVGLGSRAAAPLELEKGGECCFRCMRGDPSAGRPTSTTTSLCVSPSANSTQVGGTAR